jgi:cell division protein FtsB
MTKQHRHQKRIDSEHRLQQLEEENRQLRTENDSLRDENTSLHKEKDSECIECFLWLYDLL